MPIPRPIEASDQVARAQLPNLTAATVLYVPVTGAGRVKSFLGTVTVATATGTGTIQLAYAPPSSTTFTNITDALLSFPSGSAAGTTLRADVNNVTNAFVQDGGTFRFTVGGTATGGGTPNLSVVVGA